MIEGSRIVQLLCWYFIRWCHDILRHNDEIHVPSYYRLLRHRWWHCQKVIQYHFSGFDLWHLLTYPPVQLWLLVDLFMSQLVKMIFSRYFGKKSLKLHHTFLPYCFLHVLWATNPKNERWFDYHIGLLKLWYVIEAFILKIF